MADPADLTEAQIIDLMTACAENATDLLEEARLLYSNRHYSRAYVLAQLASEECTKPHLLLSLLLLRVAGLKPPMKSFWAHWFKHDDKTMFQDSWNEALSWPSVQNWLNLPPDPAAEQAPEWMEGLAASLVTAKHRAPSKSILREDATYVDFRNGKIYVPRARIGRGRAQRRIAEATVELARAKEITAAQWGVLIQIPEAVNFMKRMVATMIGRIAAMAKPSET